MSPGGFYENSQYNMSEWEESFPLQRLEGVWGCGGTRFSNRFFLSLGVGSPLNRQRLSRA